MPAKPSISMRQVKPTRDRPDWQPRKIITHTIGGTVSLPAVSMHLAAINERRGKPRKGNAA